ncbi:MAG: replication-associated recombination protein A [Eubacteriales bacterium]|nr:replication-associated recombination protein A [Eubacteriales bacterium]MDD3199922.1 replication-associated recombination protein A [Eubacteriales bacterium]MDD4122510.1 replication-associated recombination protein A [Eubacteriales bacterium]MDD4630431.1 replication-associated recombination protein A [Eubacteriales bacterium]
MIPLSTRMRPETVDEFVGQRHFMYKESLLYNAIKNKTFDSAIFYGPSGTGKTTLARLIVREMDADFHELNASATGIKELKEIIDKAKLKFFGMQKETTYIYVDEFHRWNKLQQDSLLKALEEGVLRFIGSTTENPYFAVNNAILSRVGSIYEFKRLEKDDIYQILIGALNNSERGLGKLKLDWDDDAIHMLADMSSGDARIALDALGFISENLKKDVRIDKVIIGEAMQRQTTFYDRGEDKYNLLSALQKSVRGSDPDAAIHYLARLLEGGADIQMIGRRLMVMASEDVGMAYPSAISIVTGCVQASLMIGLPEAKINLAHATILLASCPKSNSAVNAIETATEDLRKKNIDDVPDHLKDSHYSGARKRGLGVGYKYPHTYGGYVKQQYLPNNLYQEGVRYYLPTENGKEGAFKKFLESLKQEK